MSIVWRMTLYGLWPDRRAVSTVVRIAASFLTAHPAPPWPGLWLDRLEEPFHAVDPLSIEKFGAEQPAGANVRLLVTGESFCGDPITKVVLLPFGPKSEDGRKRLFENAGISVDLSEGKAVVSDIKVNSPAQKWGMDFDWVILELQMPTARRRGRANH